MKNTNTTNNTNNINNINTAENAAAKVRKHNKKVIASIFAVVSAAAVITSIAVFTASASTIKDAPKAGESGYCYDANQNVTDTSAVKPANIVKHPGESGYCYDANQNGTDTAVVKSANIVKHPGESGYCYDVNQNPAAEFKSGRYVSADGTRAELVIAKPDDIVCYCTIRYGNTYNNDTVYGFMGTVKGSEIEYTRGSKNDITYDNNGNVAKAIEIDRNHEGTIKITETGTLHWIDSDGTNVNFIPEQAL